MLWVVEAAVNSLHQFRRLRIRPGAQQRSPPRSAAVKQRAASESHAVRARKEEADLILERPAV